MSNTLILCDCLGSQAIDTDALTAATGLKCTRVYSALCTKQLEQAAAEIAKGDAIIACAQERDLFEEIAAEIEVPVAGYIDLRDRAGWSDEGGKSGAKMAALISDALLEKPAEKTRDVVSEGRCLILGASAPALGAATQLAETLAVTVLLENGDEIPTSRGFDIVVGSLKKATGTLGNFTVEIDALQQVIPGGRGAFGLTDPRDGGMSECDIILDLSGGTKLFSAGANRDGYLRADPRDPPAMARVIFEAAQYIGTFEKPLYVKLETQLCAHSRARITGCTRCIDACKTGAITSNGDHVSIDPMICAGCGDCSALCPSGAITFDAPPTAFQHQRIANFASTFAAAGGKAPRLLVCDATFGSELISLSARFGRGLPADVIPFEISALESFGHVEALAALACGFQQVDIILPPKTDAATLESECALAQAIAGAGRIRLITPTDPDTLEAALWDHAAIAAIAAPITPTGSRRQMARMAALALNPDAGAPLPLPASAPYATAMVNSDACTLCLSCAAQCPSGALGDNPDAPELRFQEDACLNCGLCVRVCPENAISLVARLNLSDQSLTQIILHKEDPFECIECGSQFGTKSTIERISAQLAEKHSMFATSEAARLIKMCDTCRITSQYKQTDNPFQGAERTPTRTTDDYLKKRKDH